MIFDKIFTHITINLGLLVINKFVNFKDIVKLINLLRVRILKTLFKIQFS